VTVSDNEKAIELLRAEVRAVRTELQGVVDRLDRLGRLLTEQRVLKFL